MSEPHLRLTCGNTIMWYDGPVMSWAILCDHGREYTGILQDLAREAPHDQILAIFNATLRRRFLKDELCLRQLMENEGTRLWGVVYKNGEPRLTRLVEPQPADLLPNQGMKWSTLSGNDRARHTA